MPISIMSHALEQVLYPNICKQLLIRMRDRTKHNYMHENEFEYFLFKSNKQRTESTNKNQVLGGL